jgi:ADP-ribose pyrophosphatase
LRNMPRIVECSTVFATPWFELVSKRVESGSAPFYAVRTQDYVSVVACTQKAEIVMVRQFRPAVEQDTLELPSGHVEQNESPEESARRELMEETGYRADQMIPLGALLSDTGRLENKTWGFIAPDVQPVGGTHTQEPGVQRVLVPKGGFLHLIRRGEFNHALNLAIVMQLVVRMGLEWLTE